MKELYKKTKWLRFYIVGKKPKTLILYVINTKNQFLGEIFWYGAFHQYAYKSEEGIIYNNGCLQDIADVLTSLNAAHKQKNQPLQSGKYTFYQDGCKAIVLDIVFDSEGNLMIAKDGDGNNWKQWLIDYKALDTSYPDTRLEKYKT